MNTPEPTRGEHIPADAPAEKLVRDGIPDEAPHLTYRTATRDERRRLLGEKLLEAALEAKAAAATPGPELVEELADVLEVVTALAAANGTLMSEVREAAQRKREQRGGFGKGVVLVLAPTDPRAVGGAITGPSSNVVIDSRRAVLMDHVYVARVETPDQGIVMALQLSGRINKSTDTDRAQILFLFDGDGGASIVAELLGLAGRMGSDYVDAFTHRAMERLAQAQIDARTPDST